MCSAPRLSTPAPPEPFLTSTPPLINYPQRLEAAWCWSSELPCYSRRWMASTRRLSIATPPPVRFRTFSRTRPYGAHSARESPESAWVEVCQTRTQDFTFSQRPHARKRVGYRPPPEAVSRSLSIALAGRLHDLRSMPIPLCSLSIYRCTLSSAVGLAHSCVFQIVLSLVVLTNLKKTLGNFGSLTHVRAKYKVPLMDLRPTWLLRGQGTAFEG